jgi:methionine-rich copper-binding protein CopC
MPLVAAAHAHLEQAEPADGAVLTTAPPQFKLRFSDAVQLTALSLASEESAKPQKLGPLPASAVAQFNVPAPALSPGHYELRYRVISADGHVMAGSVHFSVAAH